MVTVSDPAEFRCGLYALTFAAPEDAVAFVARYRGCPNWPIVTPGPGDNEVLVVELELIRQQHGEPTEINTLVEHPEYLGAQSVRYQPNDRLFDLFPGYGLTLGTADTPPCGSTCGTCPLHQKPCQGCPATWSRLP